MNPFAPTYPKRWAPIIGLAAFAVVATWGCGKDAPGFVSEEDKAEASPRAETVAAFPGVGKPADVALKNSGKAPKKVLEWKPVVGQTTRLKMSVNTSMRIAFAGSSQPPMQMPIEMVIAITTKSVDGDQFTVDFAYDSVNMSIANVPKAMLKTLSDEMKQLKGSFTVTRQGAVTSVDFDIPKGGLLAQSGNDQLMSQMKDQLGKLTVPFPKEPVGVGARWEVSETVELMGMKMRTLTTVELARVTEDGGALVTTIKQTAAKGPLNVPGLAASGAKATIERAVTNARGEIEFSLATPFAMTGKVKGNTDIDAEISAQGQTGNMKMAMEMGITMRRLEGSAGKPTLSP